MSSYIVKQGETIGDVALNSTGSLLNWDAICFANGFTDWTPILMPGQVVIIPSTVAIDVNTQRQLQAYPVCNSSVPDVYDQITTIFSVLTNNWILATGFWNDDAVWNDDAFWID